MFDGGQLSSSGVDVQSVDNFVFLADNLPEVRNSPLSFPELLKQTLLPLHLIPQLISEIFLQNFLLVQQPLHYNILLRSAVIKPL